MNSITQRYLDLISYLIDTKIVKDGKDFATLIGISVSSITEISKKRTNVGLSIIQKTVLNIPFVNLNWLILGEGEMLHSELGSKAKSQPQIVYKSDPKDIEIIELQRRQIELLEEKLNDFKKDRIGKSL